MVPVIWSEEWPTHIAVEAMTSDNQSILSVAPKSSFASDEQSGEASERPEVYLSWRR